MSDASHHPLGPVSPGARPSARWTYLGPAGTFTEAAGAYRRAVEDPEVKVIVLGGEGKHFSDLQQTP